MVKNLPANAGGLVSIAGLGRSPGEGKGNPFQYSCWKIPWTEGPGGCKESDTTEQINAFTHKTTDGRRRGTTDLLNHRLVIALESCAAELGGGRVWVPYSMPVALSPPIL